MSCAADRWRALQRLTLFPAQNSAVIRRTRFCPFRPRWKKEGCLDNWEKDYVEGGGGKQSPYGKRKEKRGGCAHTGRRYRLEGGGENPHTPSPAQRSFQLSPKEGNNTAQFSLLFRKRKKEKLPFFPATPPE